MKFCRLLAVLALFSLLPLACDDDAYLEDIDEIEDDDEVADDGDDSGGAGHGPGCVPADDVSCGIMPQ
jgi:hypothetical protein